MIRQEPPFQLCFQVLPQPEVTLQFSDAGPRCWWASGVVDRPQTTQGVQVVKFKCAGPASMKCGWSRVIRRSTLYGVTLVTQVAVFNVAAALTVDFGLAISTLIAVTDVAAALTVHLRLATGPKVAVPDIAAALAIGFGFAISALIAVTDVAATSMGVGTQHQ